MKVEASSSEDLFGNVVGNSLPTSSNSSLLDELSSFLQDTGCIKNHSANPPPDTFETVDSYSGGSESEKSFFEANKDNDDLGGIECISMNESPASSAGSLLGSVSEFLKSSGVFQPLFVEDNFNSSKNVSG